MSIFGAVFGVNTVFVKCEFEIIIFHTIKTKSVDIQIQENYNFYNELLGK